MLQPLSTTAATTAQASPLDALQGVDTGDKTAVRKAAEDFEAVFLNNILQNMFTGLESGGTWGKGHGADAWQSLLIDEYSRTISAAGGIGLADSVEKELLRLQEGS